MSGRTPPQAQEKLNFFELASIPTVSLSLPLVLVGDVLAKKYGAASAILSILIGNLILWIIAIAIISMAQKTHLNAIENIKGYLGHFGTAIVALVLILAFMNWYALQINTSLTTLDHFFDFHTSWSKDIYLRLGASLGVLSALFATGGIRLFKNITVICLPLFICFYLYEIIKADYSIIFTEKWRPSFGAVLSTILLLLPGFINFPTIFQHSRSRAHSYLGLTLSILLISIFEISTIWIKLSNPHLWTGFQLVLITIYILMTLACSNLLNIFFASACWQTIVPKFGGAKGYAIIGLLGTLTYTFLQISSPVLFFERLTNCYMASLGAVLLMAHLMRITLQHRPRPFEKTLNLAAWIFGCVVATIYESRGPSENFESLLSGVGASVLFFMSVVFIEETTWAIKTKLRIKA